ncbi:SDR family oxidoreductase [Methanoculleus sp. FWC-SCC1]|uniref:SDR family oxidoreductase n=1 Tax=Methanoculleus frigidifontis TaxID=2584085 RepID=A0ABT8M8X4_9EURY|nr:SDR family oxidoreductase [Methanoculleus sp. FWC-SCC1]MDN7024370.1 SDR family oxidoreductase [Methanoculleus sp. FWC-SCC1]
MAGRLEGEIAVVTGSDSGIGHATAVAFAREGADVAVTIHEDVAGAERTAKEVGDLGRRALLVNLDQRDPKSVEDLFRRVAEELGTPTILVNDAGIDSTGKHVGDMPLEDWDDEIRTNLYGPFYCAREFIRGLAGSDLHGTIINITSVHQEIPRAGASGYCAAKGALRNLTRCLALELAESNITVKNIAPGMVLTPFNQPAIDDPEILREQVASIPQKRAAEPEEIAKVAVFLASREADYIHGTTVYVDGGLMQNQGQGA